MVIMVIFDTSIIIVPVVTMLTFCTKVSIFSMVTKYGYFCNKVSVFLG